MRKKMLKLAGALLILAGGLAVTLTPKNADALTCRQLLDECSAACDPQDSLCSQDCQCQFLNCKGYQCN
jgi:hypothetical protein